MKDRATFEAPAFTGSFDELRQELVNVLVAQGLFEKEGQAMVETWRDSWFEEGSRLIFVLPSPAVEAILPLQVEPAPSMVKRVYVGRIELITAETQRAVHSAFAERDWAKVEIYGRFLSPILRRVYAGHSTEAANAESAYRAVQSGSCK